MYQLPVHPLLHFLAIAMGIALGFLLVADPRGPLKQQPPLTRYATLVLAAYVASSLLLSIFLLLTPLLNGLFSGLTVLGFLGGIGLIGALAAALLSLRGELKIQIQGRSWNPNGGEQPSTASSPVTLDSGLAAACPKCGSELKPGAMFCNGCGARVDATG